jgi:hypothetical protein
VQVVGTGSEDASSILFDLRSHGPLNKFSDDSVMLGIFSVCFSKSGRLMFAGYEERMCYAWETISSEGCVPVCSMRFSISCSTHTPHPHTRPHSPTLAHFSHCCLEPPGCTSADGGLPSPPPSSRIMTDCVCVHLPAGRCHTQIVPRAARTRQPCQHRGCQHHGQRPVHRQLGSGPHGLCNLARALCMARCVAAVFSRRVVDAVCEVVALLHVCIASAPV